MIVLFAALYILSCSKDQCVRTDFALLSQKDNWLRHPVLGDPSFDSFSRYEKNPVQRGTPPFEWPVNGFLFHDPVSGNEYIYASQYLKGYARMPDKTSTIIDKTCIVFRSRDQGKTWNKLGPVFKKGNIILEGEKEPVMTALDASVVYDEGKYYMLFGFSTFEFDWQPDKNKHGGLALAVSDSPEGPFTMEKIVISSQPYNKNPVFGKYNRCYAGTLLKTQNNWVITFMMDSGPFFSWGLFAVSASSPEGPWSEPVLIRGCEGDKYYPPLLEYFPAFMYNDTIYAPATSVAINRNFQCILKVPSREAMTPGKWELSHEGSLWHGINRENEFAGIWGQTFSGFIDQEKRFKVMFPSLDPDNQGTINLASVPWNALYRERGFVFTGHEGPSFTTIPGFYQYPEVNASFSFYGTIFFAMNSIAPAGPDYPKANSSLHELMFTSQNRIELSENQWAILNVCQNGKTDTISKGPFTKKAETTLKMTRLKRETLVSLNNELVWKGKLENTDRGRIGLYAMKHSGIEMQSFKVSGENHQGYVTWLYTEGLLGSGANMKRDWAFIKDDPSFLYGSGVVSKVDTARAKWNFSGSGFDLYCPRMPGLGTAEIILNGKTVGEINLYAECPEKSKVVYSMRSLPQKKNALVLKGKDGKIVLDCLRVYD